MNPFCRAGQAASGAAHDVFASIAGSFGKAAQSAVDWLWGQIDSATAVSLTSAGIATDLVATGAIAALVAFGLFLIQVIASGLRQDAGGLGRAVRGLGVAFLGSAFAISATQLLLGAVDALADGVVRFALGTNVRGMGSKLVAAAALGGINNPAALLLMSLLLLGGVVIIWGALMVRKLLIIVAAVFAPLAFSGATADITRSWVRRWIEFTAALIFSKLILVIIFMIGLSVLDGAGQTPSHGAGGTGQSLTQLAVGALTLLLAGFAPWIAIRMVHFAGDSFVHVHAQATASRAGAASVVAAPQKLHSGVNQAQAMGATLSRANGSTAPGGSPTAEPAGQSPTTSTAAAGKTYAATSKGFAVESRSVGAAAGPTVAAATTAIGAAGAAKDRAADAVNNAGAVNSGRSDTLPPGKNLEQNPKGLGPSRPPRAAPSS